MFNFKTRINNSRCRAAGSSLYEQNSKWMRCAAACVRLPGRCWLTLLCCAAAGLLYGQQNSFIMIGKDSLPAAARQILSRMGPAASMSQLIPFQDSSGKWGYMDRRTRKVKIRPAYQSVRLFDQGLAEVTVPNPEATGSHDRSLHGWIDTLGQPVFEPVFTAVYTVKRFGNQQIIEGLKSVRRMDGTQGIIDLQTRSYLVEPGSFRRFFFYDRSCFVADKQLLFVEGDTYQAPAGTVITSLDRENRLFYIQKGNDIHKGICRWNGQIIVPPKYMDVRYVPACDRYLASRFHTPIRKVTLLALLGAGHIKGRITIDLLDGSGKKLGSYRSDEVADTWTDSSGHYSLGSYSRGDSSFYFDLKTGKAVPRPFEGPGLTYQGYIIRHQDSKWSLNGPDGQLIIAPSYTRLAFVGQGRIRAAKLTAAGQFVYGLLDLSGRVLIPVEYTRLEYVDQSDRFPRHFRASKNGKHGVFDPQGKIMVPFVYDNDVLFRGPRAIVYKDHHHGVIDRRGREIIPAVYKSIFSSKLHQRVNDQKDGRLPPGQTTPEYYAVENDQNRWGLMDSAGKTLIAFNYGYVSCKSNRLDQQWVLIEDSTRQLNGRWNLKTGVVIEPEYAFTDVEADFIKVAKREGPDYKYQLLDLQGRPLSDTGYTLMAYQTDLPYFICRKDGKYGVLSTLGQLAVPLKYDYLWSEGGDLLMALEGDDYFIIDIAGNEYRTAVRD